jgi:hypothetical protein
MKLVTVGEINIQSNVLISRFMKGVFNSKPPLPRFKDIWDANIILQYLEKMTTEKLVHLSCKLWMLFLQVTAQRCKTFKISGIILKDGDVIIYISSLLNRSQSGFHLQPIVLRSYPNNTKLCIVAILKNIWKVHDICERGNIT